MRVPPYSLAFRADVDRTFVSRLERGIRQPTITTLIGLAEALGTSASILVQEAEAEYKRAKPRK
jgi:transcriptional regulator with XRE-family HTH domain